MQLLRQHRRRWAIAAAIAIVALLSAYVAMDALGVLRNRGSELAAMPPPQRGDRLLIIAPHEDDETLGCGGYMQAAVAAGAEIYVCLMTDGEGEELGATWANRRPALSPADFVRLGEIRQHESREALTSIGVAPDHILFLNYPNMGLSPMWTAHYFSRANPWRSTFTRTTRSPFPGGLTSNVIFCGEAALNDLERVLARVQPTRVLTVHPADIHPDHWATYCFTKLAVAEMEARHALPPSVPSYTYLVHRRGWPVPWGYYPRLHLAPPPSLARLSVNEWFTFPLSLRQTAQKNRMIVDYRSQAPAFDFLLRAFDRRNELFAQIGDLPMGDCEVTDRRLLGEPTRETEFLRRHPSADLAWVDFFARESTAQVRIGTVASLTSNVNVTIMLTTVNPPPGQPRALLVQYQKGTPQVNWLVVAGNNAVPRPAPLPVTVTQFGNVMTLHVPSSYAGGGRPVLLDVQLRAHRHIVDHSITRLFQPAAKISTGEKVESSD
jgi:LmbE family N-acetylglucosaminyl deacetylase